MLFKVASLLLNLLVSYKPYRELSPLQGPRRVSIGRKIIIKLNIVFINVDKGVHGLSKKFLKVFTLNRKKYWLIKIPKWFLFAIYLKVEKI